MGDIVGAYERRWKSEDMTDDESRALVPFVRQMVLEFEVSPALAAIIARHPYSAAVYQDGSIALQVGSAVKDRGVDALIEQAKRDGEYATDVLRAAGVPDDEVDTELNRYHRRQNYHSQVELQRNSSEPRKRLPSPQFDPPDPVDDAEPEDWRQPAPMPTMASEVDSLYETSQDEIELRRRRALSNNLAMVLANLDPGAMGAEALGHSFLKADAALVGYSTGFTPLRVRVAIEVLGVWLRELEREQG